MNIVLIGYRCTGKSSVGRLLAKKLKWNFVDTDKLIEDHVKLKIEDIVLKKGWEEFRKIEKEVVKKVSSADKHVISTGGGVVLDKENVERLKRNGWIVWLKAEPDTIKKRMLKDQASGLIRPALTKDGSIKEIEKLLRIRTPLYKEASDFAIDTDSLSQRQICDMILKEFLRISDARKFIW